MSSGNNTGIKRSINALIRNRGIDSKDADVQPSTNSKATGSAAKKITVFHVESYQRDAYVFRGYDGEMVDAIKQVVCVDFHVLLNGYRAFTAPCFSYEYLEGEFEFLGYELIDRRDKHCREIDWGA